MTAGSGRGKYFNRRGVLALLTTCFAFVGADAFAATRWVNDDDTTPTPPGSSCTIAGYQSIQAAVNAANPGDTINVCTGNYPEIVVVGPGKNNLTLRAVVPLAAVIKAPAAIAADLVNFKSIVRVSGATGVTIRDFTISGPGPGGCDTIRSGIRVDSNGSATIHRNHIIDIRDNPLSGCQNGVGIQVGRRFDLTTGRATITENWISRYQKNGMTVDNVGSSGVIVRNDVRGIGPTPIIAQNGIQISRGAFGDVRNNTVSDNTYSLAPATGSTGILIFGSTFGDPPVAPGTVVAQNFVVRNDDNIGVYGTSEIKIVDNRVLNATFFDGIFMNADTSLNKIIGNFLRNNLEHDCHDDSVVPDPGPGPDLVPPAPGDVANFWIKNNGLTSFPAGLCKGDDDGEEEDDDDHDDDGENNHDDEDDDNDGHHDNDDEDDDNDGHHDSEDEDDDNDRIHDDVDSKDREKQRSSGGTVGGGQYVDQTMAVEAGTLSLSGLVQSPNADRLKVEIYNPLGLLVGIAPPALGQALIKVPVSLPGIYTVRVRNTGATPVDYVASVVRSVPWP